MSEDTVYWGESILVVCPTTHQAYTPTIYRVDVGAAGDIALQSKCRHCDASGHTRAEPAFDPAHPQAHVHFIKRAS